MDRSTADYMAARTIINGMALQEALEKVWRQQARPDRHRGEKCRRAVHPRRARAPSRKGARRNLRAGTGNPFFSTIRRGPARQRNGRRILLKATKVTASTTATAQEPKAKRFTRLSYADALVGRLQ